MVGNAGPRKGGHTFQNFNNLKFSFSHEENTTYKVRIYTSRQINWSVSCVNLTLFPFQGIKAIRYNFSATIPGPNATLNVPMYLFTENGTFDVCDDEEVGVIDGVLKYNVEVNKSRLQSSFGVE